MRLSANTWLRIGVNGGLLLILAVLVLAGCGSWHGTGTVTRMDFDNAHTTTYYDNVCYSHSSSGTCTFSMMVPRDVYYPSEWSLKVKDQKDGKTHKVVVSEYLWNRTQIGDTFTNGDEK